MHDRQGFYQWIPSPQKDQLFNMWNWWQELSYLLLFSSSKDVFTNSWKHGIQHQHVKKRSYWGVSSIWFRMASVVEIEVSVAMVCSNRFPDHRNHSSVNKLTCPSWYNLSSKLRKNFILFFISFLPVQAAGTTKLTDLRVSMGRILLSWKVTGQLFISGSLPLERAWLVSEHAIWKSYRGRKQTCTALKWHI